MVRATVVAPTVHRGWKKLTPLSSGSELVRALRAVLLSNHLFPFGNGEFQVGPRLFLLGFERQQPLAAHIHAAGVHFFLFQQSDIGVQGIPVGLLPV